MLKQVVKQSLLVAMPVLTLASTAHAVSDAELMKQGIWRDPKTGLMWDRCSVGQLWNGTTCTGEPIKLNWQDAKDYVKKFTNEQTKGGYTNWRLPTIEELSSIRYCSKGWYQKTEAVSELTVQGRVERNVNLGVLMSKKEEVPYKCANDSRKPTINTTIFPNTKEGSFYWSSSPYNARYTWAIYFDTGSADGHDKDSYSGFHVRAVRSE